jgi:hypothetical protein
LTDHDALPDALPDEPNDPPDERDVALLGALAAALGPADSSDELTDRCRGLVTWIDIDAELAVLLDQAPAELAGTRGAGGTSADLEFTVDDGTCVIEVKLGDGHIRGQILGAAPEQVTLRVVTGVVSPAHVDELGSFEIADPPPGSARIELDLGAGRRIHTDWFVI